MKTGLASFDIATALQCALACQAVYESAAITTAEAHANVIDCGGRLAIVALRGTKNIRDIITDVSAWRENIQGMDVHKGFYASAMGIGPQINAALDAIQSKYLGAKLSVLVTGHSLGGAQAIFTAYRLCGMAYKIAGVYTFGQPRVAGRRFMGSYDSALGPITFRVTNGADIVPWVPWLLGTYWHGSIEEYLPHFGESIIENPSTLRKLATNGVELYREWKLKNLAGLADHHIENYLHPLNLLNTIHQTALA